MFEGNISGLLRMSNKSDGIGEASGSYGGGYDQRRKSVRNHFIKTGYKAHKGINFDPETGEILDYVPPKNAKNPYSKMAYAKRYYSKAAGLKLPNVNPSQVINLAICAAIGYGGYILYNKILKPLGNSPIEDAKDKAEAAIGGAYVDTTASKVTVNNTVTNALAKSGLKVTTAHQGYANTLHDFMNSAFVDEDKIIKTIKGMAAQTFQLTASAYGTRNLNTYAKSPTHLLTVSAWSDLFSSDKLVGTLKTHLQIVLSESEQKQISQWLSIIN